MKVETGMSYAAHYRLGEKLRIEAFEGRYFPHGREKVLPVEPRAEVSVEKERHPLPGSGSIIFQKA